ncbi:hypothetical protein M2135_001098 [Parabacteroides sp. PF5-9]|nr:hypothetical protein [Parabacteroides sp. PF5-9]
MLDYVSSYSITLNKIVRVIDSCKTLEQLENAYNWADKVVKNFFAKVISCCKSDVNGIEKLREQTLTIINERYGIKNKVLNGRLAGDYLQS